MEGAVGVCYRNRRPLMEPGARRGAAGRCSRVPGLTDSSVAAWWGSKITPGDWLPCCGAGDGVVRRVRVEVGCCLVSPCVCLTGPGVAEKDRRRAINEGED